jgi:NAD(P)H-dependent FMN reductase
MSLKLNIIFGSTRPGRAGLPIGNWLREFAMSHGKFDVKLVELADFNLPLLDEAAHPVLQQYQHEHTKRWSESVASADAYVFVTPEYDYFPPASLVNAVQVVMREWAYKPAGVVSYGGISGGLRASQSLRQLITSVNVHPLPQVVPIPSFAQFIGDDGLFRPNPQMTEGTTGMLDELFKWALALKPMRLNTAA